MVWGPASRPRADSERSTGQIGVRGWFEIVVRRCSMERTILTDIHREALPADAAGLVSEEVLDALMERVHASGTDLLGPEGLLSQMTKAVLERALAEELSDHLGYERGDADGIGSGNSRNGATPKRLHTDVGTVDLEVPRDRDGSFEPRIVAKGQTRLDGFNERIIGTPGA